MSRRWRCWNACDFRQGDKAVKVVGINGSARRDGNTALIIKAVFEELEAEGIETELV